MTQVLVTGAGGFVGSHLVEKLLQLGMEVTCILHPKSNKVWLKDLPVSIIYTDLLNAAALIPAVKNKDIIYHLAGQRAADSDEEYYQKNVQSTVNLLKTVHRYNQSIKHFIFISSIAVTGPSQLYKPHTEESEPHPISPYGQCKLSAEEAVMASQWQIPVTIVRAPVIFGPRDIEVLRLIKIIKMGFNPILGFKKRSYSMIYINDFVDGIIKITNQDITKGQLYYLANSDPVSWNELVRIIGDTLHKKRLTIYIPIWLFISFIYLHDCYASRVGKSSLFNVKRRHELIASRWECLPTKIREDVHFIAETPLKKAFQRTIDWYIDRRWLS